MPVAGCGSVLLRRQCGTLRIFCFVDDVIFYTVGHVGLEIYNSHRTQRIRQWLQATLHV